MAKAFFAPLQKLKQVLSHWSFWLLFIMNVYNSGQSYLKTPLVFQTTKDPLFLISHVWKPHIAFPINAIAAMLGNFFFWNAPIFAFEHCGSQTITASGFFWGDAVRLWHHLRIQGCESVTSKHFFTESTEEDSPFLNNVAFWSNPTSSLPLHLPIVSSELVIPHFKILLKNLLWEEASPIFELLVPWAEFEALCLRRFNHLLLGSRPSGSSGQPLEFKVMGCSAWERRCSASKLWVLDVLVSLRSTGLDKAGRSGSTWFILRNSMFRSLPPISSPAEASTAWCVGDFPLRYYKIIIVNAFSIAQH